MWVMESKGLRGFGQFMWFGEVVCQETISATTFTFNLSPRSFAYFYSTVFWGVKAILLAMFKWQCWWYFWRGLECQEVCSSGSIETVTVWRISSKCFEPWRLSWKFHPQSGKMVWVGKIIDFEFSQIWEIWEYYFLEHYLSSWYLHFLTCESGIGTKVKWDNA